MLDRQDTTYMAPAQGRNKYLLFNSMFAIGHYYGKRRRARWHERIWSFKSRNIT